MICRCMGFRDQTSWTNFPLWLLRVANMLHNCPTRASTAVCRVRRWTETANLPLNHGFLQGLGSDFLQWSGESWEYLIWYCFWNHCFIGHSSSGHDLQSNHYCICVCHFVQETPLLVQTAALLQKMYFNAEFEVVLPKVKQREGVF